MKIVTGLLLLQLSTNLYPNDFKQLVVGLSLISAAYYARYKLFSVPAEKKERKFNNLKPKHDI